MHDKDTLDWESVGTLNPPTTSPLLPNLRHLQAVGRLTAFRIKHLLYMPFPCLISLGIVSSTEYLDSLRDSLEPVLKLSPNIRILSIKVPRWPEVTFSDFFSGYICRWRDLQTVDCGRIASGADALAHLSQMPSLTRLSCTPNATLPPADSPLSFSNLHHLKLSSEYLDPVSQFLSWIRPSIIMDFPVLIYSYPSKQCFSSFLSSV